MRIAIVALLAAYSVLGTGCIQSALIAGGGALAYDNWQQRKTNARQDGEIGALKDSLKATDNYIASKPWQADIEAYNASKVIAPPEKSSVKPNSYYYDKWAPQINGKAVGRE